MKLRKFPTRPEIIQMAKKTILRLRAEGQHARADHRQQILNEFYPENSTTTNPVEFDGIKEETQ